MTDGIDQSDFCLVFLTSKYLGKINTDDDIVDNCKFEFFYSVFHKTPAKMMVVVLETGLEDPKKWQGAVCGFLGTHLYVSAVGNITETITDNILDKLSKKGLIL
eukprot:Lithocolla_globosa_v1_NODE_11441_length_509_cov_2.552863.p1 type:complete len:104 gc:universal NODE_11441_length_509_cov_2.552863:2-313(+)